MKSFLFLLLFSPYILFSQLAYEGSEIGLELQIGASTLGGAIGGDLKYAAILNENLAVGPSFRLQRNWSNSYGQKFGYNIYGGGLYGHYRIQNTLFLGAEFELLHSPVNYTIAFPSKSWVPTLFLGGGFSRDFDHKIRINGGIFYDIINADNSPFRSSYTVRLKDQNGVVVKTLPIIYRISFFFPLGKSA